ncbi:MAG TPA: cation diffusion facilitator family transporter [Bacteroidales bacterium]|nr:cation diffusion facilitator family transporter [Bacteroidales bacterium]
MHQISTKYSSKKESRNLLITVWLNFVIAFAELLGGFFSNSLALISDALHNMSDASAMLITYIALKISKKAANKKHTFGYKRIQILAALFNAVTLIGICLFLIFEAYDRFLNPEDVKTTPMLIVATIGLIANLVGVLLLKRFSASNINIKAAYLHLIGDTLSSVAVIAGALLMMWKGWHWVDPLITVLISIYIIRETYHILIETYQILMQSVPPGIEVDQVKEFLIKIKEVKDVHHIHIWSLTDQQIHFEAHLELCDDMRISESQLLYHQIEHKLEEEFGIHHVTLQPEIGYCSDVSTIKSNELINK